MKKRMIALVLALTLGLSLAGCGGEQQAENTPQPTPSQSAQPEVTPGAQETPVVENTPDVEVTPEVSPDAEDTRTQVNFACLSGPTGVGAAKLLADNEAGTTLNRYNVTVAADNSEIAAKLINGDLDIACTASNGAAALYNKTNGGVQALCLSTLGVLYILEGGSEGFAATVGDLADLKGQTIWATGQGANPEYVLDYLLRENGVDPDRDVEIVWKTAQEVQQAMLSGQAQFAMLPVPAATAVLVQANKSDSVDVKSVLDLTEEWDALHNGSVLTMTTVVARTEFIRENPKAVTDFLYEYAASIGYVNANVEEASLLVEQFGIVPQAAIAKLAIPDCNLVFIDGADMMEQIDGYYQVLFEADPASVGGAVPDVGFYYILG